MARYRKWSFHIEQFYKNIGEYYQRRFIDVLTRTVAIHLLHSAFMTHRRFRSNSLCLQAMPPGGYYLLLALNSVSGVLYRS